MILEVIEPYLEVINLFLAMVIVIIGLWVATRLKGDLKKSWNYLLFAIILFGIHEIFGSLAEFGVFEIEGLYALTEFIYIVALLIAVIMFKKLFGGISKK